MKRATIYIEDDLHKALKLRSVETGGSVSKLVNDAIKQALLEDRADLADFEARENEPTMDFEKFLKKLDLNG
jgi:hypothetical protein